MTEQDDVSVSEVMSGGNIDRDLFAAVLRGEQFQAGSTMGG